MQRITAANKPPELTSDRQNAILNLIGEAKSTKEIADILGISPKTVEHHRKLLFDRMGFKSQAQAAGYAVAKGLVKYDQAGPQMESLSVTDFNDVSDMEKMTKEMVGRAAKGEVNPQQVSCFVALVGTWIHVKRLKMDARFKS